MIDVVGLESMVKIGCFFILLIFIILLFLCMIIKEILIFVFCMEFFVDVVVFSILGKIDVLIVVV